MTFTSLEKHKAALREVALRRNVYPGRAIFYSVEDSWDGPDGTKLCRVHWDDGVVEI
jgi:hypothetical protein